MARVIAPNKEYNNISAGVRFVNGVGECADPYLLSWFREKGYKVEPAEVRKEIPEEPREEKAEKAKPKDKAKKGGA